MDRIVVLDDDPTGVQTSAASGCCSAGCSSHSGCAGGTAKRSPDHELSRAGAASGRELVADAAT